MLPIRRSLLAVPAALIVACSGESSTGPLGGATQLTPGQSLTISGRTNSERLFRVEVPEGTGTLQVLLTGGTGDADLVIRRGAPPEIGQFECSSEAPENEEECLLDTPGAGTWYILVVGFEAYANVRLLANLGSTPGATPLQSAVPVPNLSGGAGSFRMYRIEVPAGSSVLDVTLDGPTGDADLYVRRGSFPLLNNYDQASFSEGSVERTIIAAPEAGTWYIRVEGFTTYAGVTLTATVGAPAPPIAYR